MTTPTSSAWRRETTEKELQIPIFMNNTLYNKLKSALKNFAQECAESKLTNQPIEHYSRQLIIHEYL